MTEPQVVVFTPEGRFGALYTDALALLLRELGSVETIRASDVEPHERWACPDHGAQFVMIGVEGRRICACPMVSRSICGRAAVRIEQWCASIRPWVPGGARRLGPFPTRAEALAAEVAYLTEVL